MVMGERVMDEFGKKWIVDNAMRVLSEYAGQITVRQLHYRLVAAGMTNDVNHYKRVVSAMGDARWDGQVSFDAFIDRERGMYGRTSADETDLDTKTEAAQDQVKAWMEDYHLQRWSNHPKYVEVWIEKKALQGVLESPCSSNRVGLAPCKGYPSLTFLHEARQRFDEAACNGKEVVLLYFGDYDPSGEDIPRSLQENLGRMGDPVDVKRIALNTTQIRDYELPSVPAKMTDSRARTWDGDGVVELDAVEPKELERICEDAIQEEFDDGLHDELLEREEEERTEFQKRLKKYVKRL
jgi:hypothetical protein